MPVLFICQFHTEATSLLLKWIHSKYTYCIYTQNISHFKSRSCPSQWVNRHRLDWPLIQPESFWCESSSVVRREEQSMSLAMWPKKGFSFFWWLWSSVQGHGDLKGIRVATGEKPGDLLLVGKMEISSLGRLEISFIASIKELLALITTQNALYRIDSYFLKVGEWGSHPEVSFDSIFCIFCSYVVENDSFSDS